MRLFAQLPITWPPVWCSQTINQTGGGGKMVRVVEYGWLYLNNFSSGLIKLKFNCKLPFPANRSRFTLVVTPVDQLDMNQGRMTFLPSKLTLTDAPMLCHVMSVQTVPLRAIFLFKILDYQKKTSYKASRAISICIQLTTLYRAVLPIMSECDMG